MQRVMCAYLPFLATDWATNRDGRPASFSRTPWFSREPAPSVRPIVLTRRSGSSVFVAHACPRAVAGGVRTGMPLADAGAILPEALVLPHDATRDAATLEHLALWAQRFSPVVESAAPDALLLNVSGCARVFRGEANIVRQAIAGLAEQGIRARAAIAETVGGAWALAHASPEPAVIAPPGAMVPLLVGLPPVALRLDKKTVATLDDVGIRSIGDLLMLPRDTLPSRFGDELVRRLRQTLGETPEWLSAPRRERVYSARMAFGPTDRRDAVTAALERVIATLCEQLVAGGVAARRLLLSVYFETQTPASLWIGLSRPSRDAKHLRGLLAVRVERVDVSPGTTGLMVTATETAAWRPAQADLFDDADRPDDEAVGALIDRLANRLGGPAVVRAEAVDDHQPEAAVRYVPLIGTKASFSREPTASASTRENRNAWDRKHDAIGPPPGRRPLALFTRPRSIRVMALVPDGPPVWFRYQGREYKVASSAGPERLETGWWRGPDVRRDYFRVTTDSGQQFWVFRDLKTGDWFLHGAYE